MDLKERAARKALDFVKSGMVLGLGSGSTNRIFIELLGKRLKSGDISNIYGVPTSEASADLARLLGIPLTTLAVHPRLDLVVDGADEVDPNLNLIKGLGRALLREKVVEIHAELFVVIVDETKLVTRLGTQSPLPVELIKFEAETTIKWLDTLGCRAELWLEDDGSPFITDNGNYYARCWFQDGIKDPYSLARELADRPGIVEHGLFLDMADLVIVAGSDGIKIMER